VLKTPISAKGGYLLFVLMWLIWLTQVADMILQLVNRLGMKDTPIRLRGLSRHWLHCWIIITTVMNLGSRRIVL